jgi:hypothetical protein
MSDVGEPQPEGKRGKKRLDPKVVGNGQPPPEAESSTVVDFKEALAGSVSPTAITSGAGISPDDKTALDQYEQQLAADCILSDDDGDEPGAKDEVTRALVAKNVPKFGNYRSKPIGDFWGIGDQDGMDELIRVMPKDFAPKFDEDVDLRRVRLFETVTQDGVVRLVWAFVPEKGGRETNTWISSKLAALEHAQTRWTTMRSRKKLMQWAFRPSRLDYGEPKFSGRTPGQWLVELKKLGLLVDSEEHPYYKKATDSE